MRLPVVMEGDGVGNRHATARGQLMRGALVVADATAKLDRLPAMDASVDLGPLAPRNRCLDDARAIVMPDNKLAGGDRAAVDGRLRLTRKKMLARNTRSLQSPNLRSSAVGFGNGVKGVLVVGVPIHNEVRHDARWIAQPRLVGQHVECDLYVVVFTAARRNVEMLAVGVVANASRPKERCAVDCRRAIGIEVGVVVTIGEA